MYYLRFKIWNMKKYRILIAGLLFLSTACTDDMEQCGQANGGFRVTATVENTGAISRVTDKNNRTSFTENDRIFIGWSGSASYNYLYSGTNAVFVPSITDNDRKLWTDLLNTSSTVDVYAWYGAMNSALPAVGTNISIPQNQTTDTKMLSAICMVAHESATSATNMLNFTFHHLTARLFLSVDIVDPTVEQVDVMGATAQINHIYADGTIATDVSDEYLLSVPTDKAGMQNIRMKQFWSDQEVFHLDFECLLPPQTLGEGQNITITLANGKEYVCHTSGDLTLVAGQKTTLSASLRASDGSVFKPKLTIIPDAKSVFSGNRLFCAFENSSTGEFSYRVYDLQPDGSWGEGVPVYQEEAGTNIFLTNKNESPQNTTPNMEMSGDYVVIGTGGGTGNNNNATYFIKRSKTTGNWYCANAKIRGHGYGVCISNDFLVSGNHVNGGNNPNRSYIYPIDEDGNLGSAQDTPAGIRAYKCSIYGNVLATNSGVYEYDAEKGWVYLFSTKYGSTQRVATDGKRVITQDGSGESDVCIYNVETHLEEEWEGTKARAAQSKPIGIYGNYALAGRTTSISICYRNPDTKKWKVINPDGGFLEMMKHWDPSITLTQIDGQEISMKGTRVMIVDGKSSTSFFIENIDKMVEDYLANPY